MTNYVRLSGNQDSVPHTTMSRGKLFQIQAPAKTKL